MAWILRDNYHAGARPPVTTFTLIAIGLSFLSRLFVPGLTISLTFAEPGGKWWGFLTYPLADLSPFAVVFGGFWLYVAGGALERRWGSRRYACILATIIPLSSLPLLLGARLLGMPVVLAGLSLPLAGLTVAWCMMHRDATVLYGFVLPIPAKTLLWLELILVYLLAAVTYGPILGAFALTGPGLVYLYSERTAPDRKWRRAVHRSQQKAAHRRTTRRRRLRSVH
ncbi:MAG: rhomboid family intramembrane serine protease [Bacteroidota bacterium]